MDKIKNAPTKTKNPPKKYKNGPTVFPLKKYKNTPPPQIIQKRPQTLQKDLKNENKGKIVIFGGLFLYFFWGKTVGPFLYFLGGFWFFVGAFLILSIKN
jgi:hypothetical protein